MLISETGLGSRARAGGELEPPKARPRGQIGSPPRSRSPRKMEWKKSQTMEMETLKHL